MLTTDTTNKMDHTGYKYINLGYMDMMSEGDPDMRQVMLEMLLDELPTEIGKMRQYHDAGDWKELGSASHKMKSTLAFVGNNEMTESNKKIEEICKSEKIDEEVTASLSVLENLQESILEELRLEFQKGQ